MPLIIGLLVTIGLLVLAPLIISLAITALTALLQALATALAYLISFLAFAYLFGFLAQLAFGAIAVFIIAFFIARAVND